jgi:hypothetical protein
VKIRVIVLWIVVYLVWHVGANILEENTAKRNRLAIFHFPPLSYIIRNFCKPIALLDISFHAGFLLGVFLNPEDGGDMFLRNVGRLRGVFPEDGVSMFLGNVTHLPDYTMSQPRRLRYVYEISARPPEYASLS